MWGSALARKWGSTQTVTLNDGKGQGNNIAVFKTYVDGICAQLDLWRTSPNYRNKKFADAIAIWSGHNEVESYISYVLARVPGMTRNTVMNDAFWNSQLGIAFLQAQAGHEAGKVYPAPRADWVEAQRRVFGRPPIVILPNPKPIDVPPIESRPAPKTKIPKKTAGGVVVAGGAAAAFHFMEVDMVIVALLSFAAGVAACWFGKDKLLAFIASVKAKV